MLDTISMKRRVKSTPYFFQFSFDLDEATWQFGRKMEMDYGY
jgi:hypothetical protein